VAGEYVVAGVLVVVGLAMALFATQLGQVKSRWQQGALDFLYRHGILPRPQPTLDWAEAAVTYVWILRIIGVVLVGLGLWLLAPAFVSR